MPNNYKHCINCPYNQQQHLAVNLQSNVNSPLSIRYGRKNADKLLIFQAPGIDEWQGNTVSGNREPIDSISSHSAAARMRNSIIKRKHLTKDDYDITEAVQCFPGKSSTSNRDKQPCAKSRYYCLQYLISDLSHKQYRQIVAFGDVAYEMACIAVNCVLQMGYIQTQPIHAKHPSSGVTNKELDQSY